MQETEIQATKLTDVSCEGKKFPFDHPKVYLKIDPAIGQVKCPYCSKRFRLEQESRIL